MIRAEWIPSWTKFSVASYLLGTQRPWNVAGAPVPAPWQVPSERKPMDITGLQKITQQEICCQSCSTLLPFVASFHSCENFYAVIAQPWAIPKLSTCPPYTHHCLVQKPSCLPDVYVPCWTMTAPKSKTPGWLMRWKPQRVTNNSWNPWKYIYMYIILYVVHPNTEISVQLLQSVGYEIVSP